MASIIFLMALALQKRRTSKSISAHLIARDFKALIVTEAGLEKILKQAALRMRAAAGLRTALSTLVVGLLLVAAAVFWLRWSGRDSAWVPILCALPVATALCAAMGSFFISKRTDSFAAAVLDRRANMAEQVTTWLFLRKFDDGVLNDTQRGFRTAQCTSALQAANAIRLKKHVPIEWPVWTRAIWLAAILLLSAILMPANKADLQRAVEREPGLSISISASNGAGAKDNQATLREAPRVQVLAPAQMRKLELIATDSELPASVKRDALKELSEQIGGIPESELTQDVRNVLDLLRKEVQPANPAAKSTGSNQVSSAREAESAAATAARAAEYKHFENVEQAWAASESVFGDVRERLARYYGTLKP